uniref:helix-turn-helix domain-containing protein n=1 Tax=Acinetobacter colistiniresistens TaxID=280145 RepID=UPI0013DE9A54
VIGIVSQNIDSPTNPVRFKEFKLLVKQIRHEKALFLLKNENVSLCDIAYTLGYTEHSAFTRAFRGWTGCSPCQFRKYLK